MERLQEEGVVRGYLFTDGSARAANMLIIPAEIPLVPIDLVGWNPNPVALVRINN
jgi:hypothetical protein